MVSGLNRPKIAVAPYSKLALFYDDVMAHVDYELWAKYVNKILRKNNIEPKRLIDISCGTGSFLLESYRENREYFGCDFSMSMLQQAKKKSHDKSISYFLADMTSLALKESFDAAVCLYDSINYVLEPQGWEKNLNCVYDLLLPNGVYIFDICTERNSIKYFDNYIERGAGYGYQYVRESYFDREQRIHHNKFTIEFSEDENVYIEDHQQLILSLEEIISICEKSPLKLVDFYDGFTFRRGSEKSIRVHFVLRK